LGNRGEPASRRTDRFGRAEHISQWTRLRDQTAESRPCDRADDKLGRVGPVSELNKAAPAAPILAPGGRGHEGGDRAAARELGISRTDARRAVHRVHLIAREVREALRDMPETADNRVELDALAALPAQQQAAAVRRSTRRFQSLREIPLQICCRCCVPQLLTQIKGAANDPWM
jgi:hypothetical protein